MLNNDIARRLLADLQRDLGLTPEQAAGVVGNLAHESAGFETLQEISPTVKGSRGGYGYAQWTGPRRRHFEQYVKKNKLDPTSYEANYGFLKHEIKTDPDEAKQFNKVRGATTAAEAARLVSENYLRPGTPHMNSRMQYTELAANLDDSAGVATASLGPTGAAQNTLRPPTPPPPFPVAMPPQMRAKRQLRASLGSPDPQSLRDLQEINNTLLPPRPIAMSPELQAHRTLFAGLQNPTRGTGPELQELLDNVQPTQGGQGGSFTPASGTPPVNRRVRIAGQDPTTQAGRIPMPPGARPQVLDQLLRGVPGAPTSAPPSPVHPMQQQAGVLNKMGPRGGLPGLLHGLNGLPGVNRDPSRTLPPFPAGAPTMDRSGPATGGVQMPMSRPGNLPQLRQAAIPQPNPAPTMDRSLPPTGAPPSPVHPMQQQAGVLNKMGPRGGLPGLLLRGLDGLPGVNRGYIASRAAGPVNSGSSGSGQPMVTASGKRVPTGYRQKTFREPSTGQVVTKYVRI